MQQIKILPFIRKIFISVDDVLKEKFTDYNLSQRKGLNFSLVLWFYQPMLSELILSKSKLVPKIDGNFAHIVDLIKFFMMKKAIHSGGMDKENKLLECFEEIKGKLFYFFVGNQKN
jgi:hypothetical protein